MAEYYAFQAALLFSVAHVFVRRGLVHSNALAGSLISLGTSATLFGVAALVLVPLGSLCSSALGYFVAAGVFAPAIGQTLGYIGMERIGVARAAPIANSSPIFASIFAVIFLAEVWLLQNIVGTLLVISGVVALSMAKPAQGQWRKLDVIYPAIGALAFGASSILRKAGLEYVAIPVMAGAVTADTAAMFSFALLQFRGGKGGAEADAAQCDLAFSRGAFQHRSDAVGVLRSQPRQGRDRRTAGQLQSGADAALHGDFSPRLGSRQFARYRRRVTHGDRNNPRRFGEIAVICLVFQG